MRLFFFLILFLNVSASYAEDLEKKPFVYEDKGRRDPMWSLINSGGAVLNYDNDFLIADLALEGVMVDSGASLVIINGRILKLKDTIGQFVVSEINKDAVILIKDNQPFELRLKKEE